MCFFLNFNFDFNYTLVHIKCKVSQRAVVLLGHALFIVQLARYVVALNAFPRVTFCS